MRNLLSRLFGGTSPTARSLRAAGETAEKARLLGIVNEEPPPGIGWRCGAQDSEGKWTVWAGARKVAAFWDENDAAEWARKQNADPRPNKAEREDGKYCVNCGSRETDDSIKARGYVSCCPERYVIPEAWHVTGDRLVTGNWHLWRPADGLPSIDADHSWDDKADAQHEADHRNLLEFRNVVLKPAALAGSPDATDALAYGLTAARIARDAQPVPGVYNAEQLRGLVSNPKVVIEPKDPERARLPSPAPFSVEVGAALMSHKDAQARRLSAFLDVPIPDGVRLVVGPLVSPQDGNWWTFSRSGPERGYTRKANAQLAADRANNAPQT